MPSKGSRNTLPAADSGGLPSRRAVPRGAVIRFLILAGILVAAFAIFRLTPLHEYLTRENMIAVLEQLRRAWWAPAVLIGLYVMVSPLGLPVSPLIFGGGVVFGVWWGWIYNLIGTVLGASASFLMARALGRDLVVHIAGEALLDRAEKILEQHGFWTMVRARFLPIPFVVINFGAALAGIRWPVFLAAAVIGLAPSMVIWTYFGYAIFSVAEGGRTEVVRNLVIAIVVALLLTFLVPLRNMWKRRRYGRTD